MKYIYPFLFLFFTINAFAQKANVINYDSLAQEVIYMDDENEGKLGILFDLVEGYADQPQHVIEYGQQTLELAQSYDDKEKIIQTNFAIGKAYNQQHDYRAALQSLNQAIEAIEDTIQSENILKDIYTEKGKAHLELKEYHPARNALQKALTIFTKKRSRNDIALLQTWIGQTFLGIGDIDRAIVYFKNSERTYDKLKKPIQVVIAMCRTGMVYLEHGEDNLALNQFKKALSRAERSNKEKALGIAKKHLGKFYYSKEFYRESYNWQSDALIHFENATDTLDYADMLSEAGLTFIQFDSLAGGFHNEIEALRFYQLTNNQENIAQSLNRLGKHYIEIIGTEQAITYLDEALKINQELNLKASSADCYLHLGYIHFQNKDFKKVVQNANMALSLASEANEHSAMQKASLLLSEAYYETKNYKKAIHSRQLFDSLYVAFSQAELEKLTNKQQKTHSKYENIVSEHRTISVYKYLFWILCPFFLAALTLFYIFFNRVHQMPLTLAGDTSQNIIHSDKKEDKEQPIDIEKENASTIQPIEIQTVEIPTFDIHQQLALAQQFAQIQAFKVNDSILSTRQEAIRLTSSHLNLDQQQLEIQPLLVGLAQFISKNNLNSSAILEYDLHSNHFIPQDKALKISLLIGELMSNIVIYAFDHQFKGKIKVLTSQKEEQLILKVTHNGSKLSEHFSKERGKSLKVVHSLAQQLGSQLEMKHFKDSTVFTVKLNLQ